MKNLVFKVLDALGALALGLWFVVPVAAGPGGEPLTGPALMALLGSSVGFSKEAALASLTWIIPVFAAFRVIALVLPRSAGDPADPAGWSASVGRWAAAAALTAGLVVPFLLWGDRDSWFAAVPASAWGLGVLGLASVGISTRNLVRRSGHRDQAPADQNRSRLGQAMARLSRIRAKLLIAFMGLTTAVVVTLSVVLLGDYRQTLQQAVADGARTQVLQAASVYKAHLGDPSEIAMLDYLKGLNRVNDQASVPFRSFSFHSDLTSRYWADAPGQTPFPSLKPELSSLDPDHRFPNLPALTTPEVKALMAPGSEAGVRMPGSGTVSFAAPILISDFGKAADGTKVRHDRLLGLAVITFDEAVILAPYIQIRTDVILLTGLFLYLAAVLVYLVGSFIVTPLLHLRTNVRAVSGVLQTMVRGESRISAGNLRFEPAVRSKDEIQSLSGEIGNMVTVIKGIIPYISASTLKQAETGTALSQTKDLVFLFTDIRGFTALCEGMRPEEVVDLLNQYLDLETEIILANGGDIDKFVGDEVMAFFDGPDKEIHACRAALQIRKAMFEKKTLRLAQGVPAVDIGIGIHSGPVVFGSVGARDRMDFTSIGDTVNLAARLEGANKAYASKTIISETVYRAVRDQFLCRELDLLAVKGKDEGVRIYEVLQETRAVQARHEALARDFATALAAYRTRDWARAETAFQGLVDQYSDGPSGVFLDRVRRFAKAPPPEGWDGIFRLETK